MRFLSLFSGIEAASVAWLPLGWECVAVAEVEPFPCAVLKHHYPSVPNLGDVTKITQQQIESLGHIDVVIYGFPCQDLSVAGKRKGLSNADGTNTRSGLFYVAANIIEWSRARWSVAENVPGLFSSNAGRDFAAVVGELAGAESGLPVAGWRNTGVALGPKGLVEWRTLDAQWFGVPQRRRRVFIVRDTGDWQSREPIFSLAYSLSRHSPPSRQAREDVAGCLGSSFERRGYDDRGDTGGCSPVACLDASYARLQGASGQDSGPDGRGGQVAGAFQTRIARNGRGQPSEVCPALNGSDAGETSDMRPCVATATQARRLTEGECAKLQGFSPTYLDIIFRGKPAAAGPKYKALGNSMAVPVIFWIGQRIALVHAQTKHPAGE